MMCPICGGRTGVASTAKDADCVYRMRVCNDCGKIIYTSETEKPGDRYAFLDLRNKQKKASFLKREERKHEKGRI